MPLILLVGAGGVDLADGFGEVFGEVADGLVSVLRDDSLPIELPSEPHHVRRPGLLVGVQLIKARRKSLIYSRVCGHADERLLASGNKGAVGADAGKHFELADGEPAPRRENGPTASR